MSDQSKRFPKILRQGLLKAVEKIATPEIQKKWSVYLIGGLLALSVVQAIGLSILLPLKEYTPYFLSEMEDGNVQVSNKVGKRFVPSDTNKSYFLTKFIKGILTIDEQTRFNLPETALFVKGAALTQWNAFVKNVDQPMYKLSMDSTLRRSVKFEGPIEFLSGDDVSGTAVAWLEIKTIGAKENQPAKRIRFVMDYVLLPITDPQTLNVNPIGIYITNFRIENVK